MKYIPFIDKQTKALDATHRALMTTDRAYQGVNQELKDNQKQFLSWKQVEQNVRILSEHLKSNLSKGDRCVLLSENRPEWMITDLAIMNAGGVTVPLFTTYSEKDYEYIINDCKPKICIVSNLSLIHI